MPMLTSYGLRCGHGRQSKAGPELPSGTVPLLPLCYPCTDEAFGKAVVSILL